MTPLATCGIVSVRARALPSQTTTTTGYLPSWAWPALRAVASSWPENADRYVVEVAAADGATGQFGPCSRAVVDLVRDQLAPALTGLDVEAYRSHAAAVPLGRHRTGSHLRLARSALELALLDLASRRCGRAVTALLGGPTRASVPVYATALGVDIGHSLAPDVARWLVSEGYYGQKWGLPGFERGEEPAADIARLDRIRAAIGGESRLMVDACGRWTLDYARRIAPALAEFGVTWLEEPLGAEQLDRLPALRLGPVPPIAGGEHTYEPRDQYGQLVTGTFDVWQPDVAWCGGLRQALASADVASALGIRVYPHGSCLAGAAALAGATDPQTVPAVEFHLTQQPLREQVLVDSLAPLGGHVAVRTQPGLCGEYRIAGDAEILAEVADVTV
jgi:L-alanine-DL-glutamate epimerase-like enolase superfamily enzyme